MSAPRSQRLDWRRSSYSGTNMNCVECARLPRAVAVRDSKCPEAGHLGFPVAEWDAFLTAAKHGLF